MKRSNVALLATWVLAACGGTETQNPVEPSPNLVQFANSGCKKESAGNRGTLSLGTSRQRLSTASYAAETAGLQCVAWESTASGEISVGLINFEGACGAQWQGEAKVDAQGGLLLGLVNPKCLVAACGWCIYDWSFDVTGVKASAPLPVTIRIDTCPGGSIGEPLKTLTVTLPLDTSPKGILCRYANFSALGWQAMSLGTCGTEGMPCEGTAMCSQTPEAGASSCHDGSTCTDNGDTAQPVCAKPCTADADCGTMGAQACTAGLCRPKAPW